MYSRPFGTLSDTAMTVDLDRRLLSAQGFVPVSRVAATCLAVATDPDPASSGRPWSVFKAEYVSRLQDDEVFGSAYQEMLEPGLRKKAAAKAKL